MTKGNVPSKLKGILRFRSAQDDRGKNLNNVCEQNHAFALHDSIGAPRDAHRCECDREWSVAFLLNSPVGCERNATAELVARRGEAGATAELSM